MLQQDAYEHLLVEDQGDGVVLVTINRPERLNAANERLHEELARVWRNVDRDPDVNVAVITGAGTAFSAGGDLDMVERQIGHYDDVLNVMHEGLDIVHSILACRKPIISAINGVAVGAGLAVALLADISIASRDARMTDGHIRLGVAAGDHAAIVWPLLCGVAKAKYYLLTSEFIDGEEAERIGLVSRCEPAELVLPSALDVAHRLATGPQVALRFTKRALNQWVQQATPMFEASMAYEMLNFFGPDVVEGIAALRERRAPEFPSAQPTLSTVESRSKR